ncbi:MAG: VIT1/CCC1 transporter family protein [Candidatus Bathyarchaeia archaeon]
MNMFDGTLTTLGIIIGAYFSGAYLKTVVGAALGAGIAMGLSGFTGAYITERAEKLRKFNELKKAMLTNLTNSLHEKSINLTALFAAIIDGFSPVLAVAFSIIPFILAFFDLIKFNEAFYSSVAVSIGLLFIMGVFLGKISRENLVLSGFKMVLIGGLTALLIIIFSLVH